MASRIIIEKRLAFREAALEKLYDAYTALVDGGVKSYMIDDRQLTRFDLPALSEEIKQMENEIDQLTSELNGSKRRKAFGVIPAIGEHFREVTKMINTAIRPKGLLHGRSGGVFSFRRQSVRFLFHRRRKH